MSKLVKVTLTGIDARTDLARVEELSVRFPFVEWGVLVSPACGNRFASAELLVDILRRPRAQLPRAVHLCGRHALDWIEGRGLGSEVGDYFDRIQLNLIGRRVDAAKLKLVLERRRRFNDAPVIIQHNEANAPLHSFLLTSCHRLFDQSGGRGRAPASWPLAPEGIFCGYAGGLGPANIAAELPRIATAAGPEFWVDMETHLRTDDWLDLDKCESVLESAAGFMARGA